MVNLSWDALRTFRPAVTLEGSRCAHSLGLLKEEEPMRPISFAQAREVAWLSSQE